MRPKAGLILSPEERGKLEMLARRPKTDQRTALRARIILRCAEVELNDQVASELKVCAATVCKWRGRFVRERLQGLGDAPRSGPPRSISDRAVESVITKTLESKPARGTHWSTRSMAKQAGLSQTAVGRIWRAFGLKPHLRETFKLSTDPFFVEKVRDVVGPVPGPAREGHRPVRRREEPGPGAGPHPADPAAAPGPGREGHPRLRPARHHVAVRAPWTWPPGRSSGNCYRRHRHQEFVAFSRPLTTRCRRTWRCTWSWTTTGRISTSNSAWFSRTRGFTALHADAAPRG